MTEMTGIIQLESSLERKPDLTHKDHAFFSLLGIGLLMLETQMTVSEG